MEQKSESVVNDVESSVVLASSYRGQLRLSSVMMKERDSPAAGTENRRYKLCVICGYISTGGTRSMPNNTSTMRFIYKSSS